MKTQNDMTRREFVTASAAGLTMGGLMPSPATLTLQQRASADAGSPSRVIIDTDPGVDDALALLLAMRSAELKIEGITAVAGNVPLELTLPNALRMVEISGRPEIPVAAGANGPLLRRLVTATYAHGENGLGGAVFPEPKLKPVAQPAAEFIREMVHQYPGAITLITIGPLTNIAAALNSDAALAGMIPGLVMMGGSLSGGNITPAAEFNIYVDPEAARIVFQSGILNTCANSNRRSTRSARRRQPSRATLSTTTASADFLSAPTCTIRWPSQVFLILAFFNSRTTTSMWRRPAN
jgi:inosine-uridine nucleoside N-ribohydrolase